jgi:hypothetical protein
LLSSFFHASLISDAVPPLQRILSLCVSNTRPGFAEFLSLPLFTKVRGGTTWILAITEHSHGQQATLQAEYDRGIQTGKSWREVGAALGRIVKLWERGR